MPVGTERVHFKDEIGLHCTHLDTIDEEEAFKKLADDILGESTTYLTELQGPDELGEDFGYEPEDAFYEGPTGSESEYLLGVDDDPMLEKIKEDIAHNLRRNSTDSTGSSSRTEESKDTEEESSVQFSEHFTSVPYGILPKATYQHGRKNADIMGLVYNGKMRQFVILDGKGITTWRRDTDITRKNSRIQRALMYPKYEYRLISYIVYAKKFNCYFALGKDFSLKVLNRDFIETCSVSANLRSVLFMLFNPVGDELITGGVGGTTIWKFEQDADKPLTEIKPLANYRLRRMRDLKDVGGSWVKRVDLDTSLQHLYCCSDTDLYVYDLNGQLLFKFLRAHTMSITGCIYSQFSKTLLTCSIDREVKMWSLRGGLVHTFRGHSRAVTSLVVHPEKSSIIVTSSLDGSVRMWSLNTMEILYSVVISTDGVLWMGMTDDGLMYCATVRHITLWSLNQFYDFFAVARNRICRLSLASCNSKSTRVVAEGQDSSVRLFSRKSQKNLTTVLPPPDISPLQKVLSSCYSREYNMVFVLITTSEIWVYTTKTDPSSRVMIWNVHDLQVPYLTQVSKKDKDNPMGGWSTSLQGGPSHRATENGLGNEAVSSCHSLCILTSTAAMWTDEGYCCPIQNTDLHDTFLLMGLEDGRILFMDPVLKGKKYMEFKASKDAIKEMRHDMDHNSLITLCHLKELAMVQIWSLPLLDLQHELYCSLDISCYARMDNLFMTGHQDGCVNFYTLEPAEDWGLFKAKVEPNRDSVVLKKRPEHAAEVVAIDSSPSMRIFCSASLNGVIRIWDENQHLLTEIFMDKQQVDDNYLQEEPNKKKEENGDKKKSDKEEKKEDNNDTDIMEQSLCAACFLNVKGDLIIGYKNHIFLIDHTKVCPHLAVPEELPDEIDKESAIIEDPSVLYEGGVFLPEPVTLENYLVPFDFIEFSKDFLEGKMDPEESSEEEEETDTDSTFSFAPTDIYRSPPDSPWSLSMLDLTLDSEINKYDLRKQMNATMDEISRREQTNRKSKKSHVSSKLKLIKKQKSPKRRRKKLMIVNGDDDDIPHVSDQGSDEEMEKFDLPHFGTSPGPSPEPTPRSQPTTPEPIVEIKEPEEDMHAEKMMDDDFVLKEVPEDNQFGHLPLKENEYIPKGGVTIKTPVKELESLRYPDHSEIQKNQSKPKQIKSESRVKAQSDQGGKSSSNVKRVETPETLVSELTWFKSEDVQMKQLLINSTSDFEASSLTEQGTDTFVTDSKALMESIEATIQENVKQRRKSKSSPRNGPNKGTPRKRKSSIIQKKNNKENGKPSEPQEIVQEQPVEVKTDSSDEEEPVPERRSKYRLANIQVDVKSLMKQKVIKKPPRKIDPSPARSDHTHSKPEDQLLTQEELARKKAEEDRRLERLKKQMLKERKFPKRGNKPTKAELLAEQKRLEELKKTHAYGVAPQLKQPTDLSLKLEEQNVPPKQKVEEEYPLIQYEQDMDSFQDELWNPRETGVSGTSLMGTKLDLPQIKRGAAGTPGPRMNRQIPTPLSRGVTPHPPDKIGVTPGASPTQMNKAFEFPTTREIDKPPEEVRKELEEKSHQGRISPLKELEEEEELGRGQTPDIETAVQRQWLDNGVINNGYERPRSETPSGAWFERPRSETPSAALKKLSDSRKGPPKIIRVNLPKESDDKLDTYRTLAASPISELTESHISGHEADDELKDHARKHMYKTRKERSLLTKEEIKYIHQRPNSSFHRPKPSDIEEEPVRRPKTAHVRFQAEDLQNAFEEALDRYKNLPGTPAGASKDKILHRNDGNNFEENWQERAIERHMLLRMQKALRSKSAAQKRQLWEEQLEEKRQKLQQKKEIDTQSAIGMIGRSDSSMYVLSQVERANTSLSQTQNFSTGKPTVHIPQRPKTAAANLQKQQTDKTALKIEKPFRHKIRQNGYSLPPSRPSSGHKSEPSISSHMIDPRNPNALRPPTTKSIPSKCTRYILVSKPKPKHAVPVPTPLEEHLLAERFPHLGEKVYRHHSDLASKAKRLAYCVEYTPFVNQWM